jgi:hypothetical protein
MPYLYLKETAIWGCIHVYTISYNYYTTYFSNVCNIILINVLILGLYNDAFSTA